MDDRKLQWQNQIINNTTVSRFQTEIFTSVEHSTLVESGLRYTTSIYFTTLFWHIFSV